MDRLPGVIWGHWCEYLASSPRRTWKVRLMSKKPRNLSQATPTNGAEQISSGEPSSHHTTIPPLIHRTTGSNLCLLLVVEQTWGQSKGGLWLASRAALLATWKPLGLGLGVIHGLEELMDTTGILGVSHGPSDLNLSMWSPHCGPIIPCWPGG